jgi:tight adherence protein B
MLHAVVMDMVHRKSVAKRYDRFNRFVKPEMLMHIQFGWGGGLMLAVCYGLFVVHVTRLSIVVPVALLAAMLGFWLPYGYYAWKFRHRLKAVEEKLMDYLIALVDSLKAGQPLEAALRSVTEQYEGPIKEEFQQMLNEKSLNTTFQETVVRLAERNPFEDMKLFATAVRLTTDSGGKQVEVLSELIETIRQRREFERNLKTLTANGRLNAKIMSFLPLIIIPLLSMIAPSMMSCLWKTPQGWICLLVVFVLVIVGSLWIHKINDIEI